MAADLARTICELAAPPVRPAYLLIEAAADDPDACFSVVLYLRPATAGLIITVHHGCEQVRW